MTIRERLERGGNTPSDLTCTSCTEPRTGPLLRRSSHARPQTDRAPAVAAGKRRCDPGIRPGGPYRLGSAAEAVWRASLTRFQVTVTVPWPIEGFWLMNFISSPDSSRVRF